jgi:hypothetical protein
MAPEIYDSEYCTSAVDVYSFAMIVYEGFVGRSAFPATITLPVLCRKVSQGERPQLPESMDSTVQEIIRRGWSVDPDARGSFEDILEALRRIRFKMTPAVDESKVAAMVEASMAPKPAREFPPLVKKGTLRLSNNRQTDEMYDIPDGIIAHLTRESDGNVCDHVVDVTCGSFEVEIEGANPHSGAYGDHPDNAAMNAADLEAGSCFYSAYRSFTENIPQTRNNWLCYDFRENRIVPTHYAVRTNNTGASGAHLKSWIVETLEDGENWREVFREEDNAQLNGPNFTGTFTVAGGGECRFIRLVNIGRNHGGNDAIYISAWEIFGNLIK